MVVRTESHIKWCGLKQTKCLAATVCDAKTTCPKDEGKSPAGETR